MYDEWAETYFEVEEEDISTPWKQGRDKIVDNQTAINRTLDRLFKEQADIEEMMLIPGWVDNYGIM